MPTGPGLIKQKGTEHQSTVDNCMCTRDHYIGFVEELSIIQLLNIQSNTAYPDTAYPEIYGSNPKNTQTCKKGSVRKVTAGIAVEKQLAKENIQ